MLSGLLGVALLVTDEFKQSLDVIGIGVAHLNRVGILIQIIITVSHAESTLCQIEHIGVGVLHVSHHLGVKEGVVDALVLVGYSLGHLVDGQFLDAFNATGQWCHALLVEAHAVHAQCVEVSDLLLDRSTRIVGAEIGDDVLDLIAAVLGQLVKSAETGVLGVKRVGQHPATTRILVEILSRRCGRI